MKLRDEQLCLKALKDFEVLDTESEILFDNIVKIASQICNTKIALISLIDEERQWFKARVGLPATYTPRDISFCTYAVHEDDIMVVEDAYLDSRFKNNPLVTGAPYIRFYAGAVLRTSEGHSIGTLCVIDDRPMALSAVQIETLKGFANMIIAQLELRKKTKELAVEKTKLKQSMEVINAIPDFVGTCNLDGVILSYNMSFEDACKKEGVDHIFDYYPRWVRALMEKIAIPHAIEYGIWRGESAVFKKDGEELQVFQTVVCHRDEYGYPKYFSTIIQDISVLKSTNSRIETLTNLAPVGIFMSDVNGRPNFFNKYWLKMAGMTEAEALNKNGKGSLEAIHPEDIRNVRNSWYASIEDKRDFFMEHRLFNKLEGKTYIVKTSVTPLRNNYNEVIGYIGISLDISEQKETHEKLVASIKQLGTFIENIPAAVAMFDQDIKYVAASKSWILDYGLNDRGFDEQNIIGKSHYEVFPGITDEWKDNHQLALKGKILKKNDDHFQGNDGTTEWLNWDVRPWYNEENTVGGIMMLTEVTTEKKRALQDLVTARAEAEKASRAKSVFIANMSHEIRTPLNSIIGLSDILSQQLKEPEHAHHIKVVQKSGEVLLGLINDILDLSKIESGKVTLQKAETDLEELTEKVVQIFNVEAQKKNISISYDVEKDLGKHLGDSVRITQVFIKLLGNAIKYTPGGHISIKVSKNTTSAKGNIHVSVTDNGIGIENDKQSIIFEKFTQVESSDVRKYGGTGLGLALTRDIVELMKGEIWVKSDIGQGSCFSFTMEMEPIKTLPMEIPKSIEDAELYSKNLKILLVDDSIENRNLILAYLKKYPFEIITAENGLEALTMLKDQKFDLVFMDIQMPIMDGLTATKNFREWESTHCEGHVPIAALTAFALQEDRSRSFDAGCDLHITKPVKKLTILETIKVLVK
jgi:PAS domain S-box-containing protein